MANILSSIFGGGGANPADAAQPYLEQIPGIVQDQLSPYSEAGGRALGRAETEYGSLLDDPAALINRLMGDYQKSPSYQYLMDQAMRGANTAAAAGGTLGTPGHQFYGAQMATDLANQGLSDYLNKALGLYQTGLGGEQDLAHMGYGAAGDIASMLSANLMNQAGLAFQGEQQKQQSDADLWGGLMKGIGAAASFL